MGKELWKEELIDFFKVENNQDILKCKIHEGTDNDVSKEDEKVFLEDMQTKENCPYCGKGVINCLEEYFFKGKMCDECYKTRLLKKKNVAEIIERCRKNMYAMYGISMWQRVHIRRKFSRPKLHKYLWYGKDMEAKEKKWLFRKGDWLRYTSKLPEISAEAAIAKALLEQYICVRVSDGSAKKYKKSKENSGPIIWCILHYLFLARNRECAERFERGLSESDRKCYEKYCEQWGTPFSGKLMEMGEVIQAVKAQGL